MTSINSIFRVGEVLKSSDLEQVVFDVFDKLGRPVLDDVVHSVQGFVDAAPVFGLGVELAPEVLDDDLVVVPIILVRD